MELQTSSISVERDFELQIVAIKENALKYAIKHLKKETVIDSFIDEVIKTTPEA